MVPVAVPVSPVWGIVVDHSFHNHTAKSNRKQTKDGWYILEIIKHKGVTIVHHDFSIITIKFVLFISNSC